jgi:hypothetical protein
LDVEPKVNFFKTRKKLYTIPLCVTDTEYGPHDHEIQSFGQFCRKFVFFLVKLKAKKLYFESKFESF